MIITHLRVVHIRNVLFSLLIIYFVSSSSGVFTARILSLYINIKSSASFRELQSRKGVMACMRGLTLAFLLLQLGLHACP